MVSVYDPHVMELASRAREANRAGKWLHRSPKAELAELLAAQMADLDVTVIAPRSAPKRRPHKQKPSPLALAYAEGLAQAERSR